MINIDFDKSKAIRLRARVNENSVVKSFNFIDVNGDNVDITGNDFQLIVQKSVGSRHNLFVLSVGDGLTISGINNSVLEIFITEEQATQRADTYFYRLFSVSQNNTWLNGAFQFHNGEFNEEESQSDIVIGSEQTITINVSGTVTPNNIDGGTPESIYTNSPNIDGGTPSSIYTSIQGIDGGNP